MIDNHITRNQRGYAPSMLDRFLAGLAGYDLRLLPEYAGSLAEHEKKKLVRIGTSVFIPSFFGFWTALYFFSSFIADYQRLVFAALAFALLLLVVDCVIVTTLSKTKLSGLLIRIAMSICIGIVVSEPALLFLYQKTINAHIAAQLATEKSAAEQKLNSDLAAANQKLAITEERLQTLRKDLGNYSERKIANLRFMEAEESKKVRLNVIAADKKQQIAEKKNTIDELQAARKNKSNEIESKMLEMKEEESGKRASGKAGRGPFWEKLNGELTVLKKEAADLDKQIKNAGKEIAAIQADKGAEKQIAAQFTKSPAAEPASAPSLTKTEQAAKTLLEQESALFAEQQAEYRKNIDRLEQELAGLDAAYALSTRNDSLTQTQALYEIAAANPVLLVKIFALFFLIFFIDTAPVLVKLTVQTGYEDYLKRLAQQDFAENRERDLVYVQDSINAATEKFNQLERFSRHLTAGLQQASADRKGYAHERTLQREARRLMDGLIKRLS